MSLLHQISVHDTHIKSELQYHLINIRKILIKLQNPSVMKEGSGVIMKAIVVVIYKQLIPIPVIVSRV